MGKEENKDEVEETRWKSGLLIACDGVGGAVVPSGREEQRRWKRSKRVEENEDYW